MPRQSKGPRLYRLKTGNSIGTYVIRDGDRQKSTGTKDCGIAEEKLAEYIQQKHRPQTSRRTPAEMTVSDVLALYGKEHAPHVLDPRRIGNAISAIIPILGSTLLSDVNASTCRYYQRVRDRAPATVRKELATIQAASNFAHREGLLTQPIKVTLPPKTAPRSRWLDRSEAARLLWAARRNRHLARLVLIALYTGSRKESILSLQWMPNTQGGYVDTELGLLFRRAEGKAETKKRQPPAPLPRQLLAHMRRWEKDGSRFVVHIDGCRVGHVKRSWQAALKESGIDYCVVHDLRRTSITWSMQNGTPLWEAAGFYGVSVEVLQSVYAIHHPSFMENARRAMETKPDTYPVSGRLKAL